MLMINLSKADGHALEVAVRALAAAAAEENKHKKARESAKTIIARELEQWRGIDLDKLPASSLVLVKVGDEPVLKVERKASQRLDSAGLTAAHPAIAEEFTKPCVASYFSSLVTA